MAVIDGYTKDHMDEIIASLIVSAAVVDGDLIITREDDSTFNAGSVIGPVGPEGPASDFQPGDLTTSMRATKTGFLICQGQSVARATYPDLADALGVAPGATNFLLPDFRNRVALGAGGSIAPAVGNTGGAATHTLVAAEIPAMAANTGNESNGHYHAATGDTEDDDVDHGHDITGAGHPLAYSFVVDNLPTSTLFLNAGADIDHGGTNVTFTPNSQTDIAPNARHKHPININTSGANAGHWHPVTINAGGGGPHNNLQPYIGVNVFIKT